MFRLDVSEAGELFIDELLERDSWSREEGDLLEVVSFVGEVPVYVSSLDVVEAYNKLRDWYDSWFGGKFVFPGFDVFKRAVDLGYIVFTDVSN